MQNYPPRGQHSPQPSSSYSSPIVTLSHHLHPYQPVGDYHYFSGASNFLAKDEDPPSLILDGGGVDQITTDFPSSPTPSADPLPLLFQGHRPASSTASTANLSSVGSIDLSNSRSSGPDHSKNLRPRSASPRFGSSSGSGSGLRHKLLRPFSSRSSREGSKRRLMMTLSSSSNGAEDGDGHSHANAAFDYESLDDIHADELISTPTIPPLLKSPTTTVEAASGSGSMPAFEEKMVEVNLHGRDHEDHGRKRVHFHNHSSHDHHGHSHGHSHDQPDHSSSSSHDHHHHHPHHHHDHKNHHAELLAADTLNHHCHDTSMERAQAEQARQAMTKLIIGLVLCLTFMLVELVGGWLSKSLAIFTDAAHLTSDLVSFLISLLAIYFGQRRPTRAKSFGYYRFEVLGVLLSVASIWVLTAILLYFACHRIVYQQFEIESTSMLVVSSIGLAMNILMMLVLSGGLGACGRALAGFFCFCRRTADKDKKVVGSSSVVGVVNGGGVAHSHVQLEQQEEEVGGVDFEHGHGHGQHSHSSSNSHAFSHAHAHSHGGFGGHGHSHMNMNVRAALLHIVGDIIQSVGVLVAALLIHFWPHLKLADPICTLIFGVIVFATTYRILADTLHILMEGFPRELPLQYEAVRGLLSERLKGLGVTGVHSLHVWALTHGRNALMVHLIIARRQGEGVAGDSDNGKFEAVRVAAERLIRAELSIAQTTIQVEYEQQQLQLQEEGPGAAQVACDSCAGPQS